MIALLVCAQKTPDPARLQMLAEKIAAYAVGTPIDFWIHGLDSGSQEMVEVIRHTCANSGQILEPSMSFTESVVDGDGWLDRFRADIFERSHDEYAKEDIYASYKGLQPPTVTGFHVSSISTATEPCNKLDRLSSQYPDEARVLVCGYRLQPALFAARYRSELSRNTLSADQQILTAWHDEDRFVPYEAKCMRWATGKQPKLIERLIVQD